ncbi:MAG: bifunctional [glutamate--ammonia ligase]-adenylyl-L-tyrosine phosphorylase/[glutamate--ammonia-ligase] adenylyltransferase [Methylococcales bacterium]|nr:bifunctional [glutamate--ammonia ligase]-adenylyl-L-tyrosine phosphorylase/[glutamate--ammonia-ligase] adenylyltransferase [Methylococcales bacterium]
MTSIARFKSELDLLPEAIKAPVFIALDKWDAQVEKLNIDLFSSSELSSSFIKVWGSSQFVSDSCIRYPELLIDLVNTGDLFKAYLQNSYALKLAQLSVSTEDELMQKLRYFRRQQMVRIAWRDLAGWGPLSETLSELSWLADACIQFALAFLYQEACERRGTPVLSNGSPQQIIVLGMGKLGAYELNYSSDIDLIFAYPENGVLADRKETSYSEFFTRLCQRLVKVLDEITVDGFVFRTDIRLRPFGDSGPVIMSFEGMENYYQTQAREWERYAMIKARQVAGDFNTGAQLMAMLNAFVYRRYLDYGAFEELRSLKMQITQELLRKDRMENVKLGPGGIRECEFIGQAFQLIRGGTDKCLQVRPILEVLSQLSTLGLLPKEDAEQLMVAYGFLRRVENHIQEYQDQQTHDLPVSFEGQQRLAYSLDYADWDTFKTHLDKMRDAVQAVFDQVFSVSKQAIKEEQSLQIWTGLTDTGELEAYLTAYGFKDSAASLLAIQQFKTAPTIRRLTAKGAQTLDRLMPQLISALQKVANPDLTLKRLLGLFEAVAGRNVYLALLAENSDALAQLLKLAAASTWVCDYLAMYPILFDELLDTRALYEPLKKVDLDSQIANVIKTIDKQDLEQIMIALRQFKHIHVLKVAAADIMDVIPLMVVSDYLTYIAESIVAQVIESAWLMLVDKHGAPPDSDLAHKGFAVLGFGKLGGIELAYGSDLDLVFIYDCSDGNALTLGEKPISCMQFYGRLGLKVRHILDTKLLSGVLYDVDMRLRPNGNSGLLVTQIHTYEHYLQDEAWTWEHQALVRGRFIAGDINLKTAYEAIRACILSLPRDLENLKTEVRDMREKMRSALATKVQHQFDLKHSPGGIVDIEFMVQFGVLAKAAINPELTTYTDNVRLLVKLEAVGFFTKAQADLLTKAYCIYRDTGHQQVLQGESVLIDAQEVAELSPQVAQVWQYVME